MWKCENCGAENEDTFASCWDCSMSREGNQSTRSAQTKEFKTPKEEVAQSDYDESGYVTSDGTARAIALFVSFIGWFLVVLGFFSLIISLDDGFDLLKLFPFIMGAIGGLFLVMAGQMTRATVDTADNTGHMLAIMKKRR